MNKTALAIHGGAGTILKSLMTEELEMEYRSGLRNALETSWKILKNGGTALEAVEIAVCGLEDFPLFNAGRGSVFTHDGKNEMDAAIMNGKTLDAGAVAFVKNIKNPIKLARLVMEKTEHIFLAGDGANRFAREMDVEFADDAYFYTEHRYQQLLKARDEGVVQLDHTVEESELIEDEIQSPKSKVQSQLEAQNLEKQNPKSRVQNPKPFGTVGAVACDTSGNLAAATSTGGMTNKKYGRIGDSPIIGAGTYADNATCAVSCTGHGEFFMAGVTAYDVAARMKYKNINLERAAFETIEYLTEMGGEGGFIAVDSLGNVALPFNSGGMYRGFVTSDDNLTVEIYRN
ncbi:MAG TPA: isoaspartyl peptidase/L-asparaginase [Pyrinomonadaceae bacterium]|jgi:beta-aspartyl-peptidase (threonine type)